MRTPHAMTWYQAVKRGTETIYIRHEVPAVMWQDTKAQNVIASGLTSADSATIYVPKQGTDYAFRVGDYLVKGITPEEITDTFKISDLQKKYLHTVKIMSVDDQDFGSPLLQHWQIGGK